VSFVFSLRSIVRDLLPELETEPEYRRDLAELDNRIDAIALAAFDIYTEGREEVSRLRVNEMKRQVAWIMEKINRRDARDRIPQEILDPERSPPETVQREDPR